MKKLFIGLALALSTASFAHVSVTASQFQQWVKDSSRQNSRQIVASQSTDAHDHAVRTRYVFINGFLGEAFRHAFVDMIQTLENLGVGSDHIHKLVPSSRRSMDENMDYLRGQIAPILADNQDSIVLVGHSRGAVEALAFALTAPKEVRDRIQGVYLINGAFGGSPLADLVAGKPMPMDDRLPYLVRAAISHVGALDLGHRLPELESLLGIEFGEGLFSLTHDAQTEYWQKALSDNRTAVDELNSRIYYIRGYDKPQTMSFAFRYPAYYMDMYYGANDGIVPYEWQKLDGVGTTLASFYESHNSLITGTNVTTGMLRARSALTDAIFLAAGDQP